MFPKKKEFRKSFEVNASKLTISFNTPKRPIKKIKDRPKIKTPEAYTKKKKESIRNIF